MRFVQWFFVFVIIFAVDMTMIDGRITYAVGNWAMELGRDVSAEIALLVQDVTHY